MTDPCGQALDPLRPVFHPPSPPPSPSLLGRASAVAFGQRGDTVALLARGEAGVGAAAAEIEIGGGTALPIAVDVADSAAVFKAVDQIETELGAIDVWVNVARHPRFP